jgi:GLPGLI family protein
MKRLILFLLALFPITASAQSGAILFDRAVQYDFELPERMGEMRDQIPSANFSLMILLFNESGSLMTPAPTEEQEEEDEPRPGMNMRVSGLTQRLRMGSPSRSDQEDLLEVYVNNEDGTVAETREFMSRTFLISGSRPAYEWKLSSEQSVFLGFSVQKATAVQDSSVIEAWFTPEIPVSAGPGLFGGLPGMILSVSVDSGHTIYSATEVNLTSVEDGVIKAPEDGEEVSRDEYEQIVVEKLEELKMRRRGRRRRP